MKKFDYSLKTKKMNYSILIKSILILFTFILINGTIISEANGYCDSEAWDWEDTKIHNVTLNTINNTSPAGCQTYTDYTNISTELAQDLTYTISVTQGTCNDFYPAFGKVYIDFNQNGIFDPSEEVFSFGPTNGLNTYSGNFTVPSNAVTGATRMRVILEEDNIPVPCGNYDWGETEDYTVIIIEGGPCTNPPVPGNAITSKNQVCPSENFMLSLSGNTTGSGQTYQWQYSTDNNNWSNINGATSSTYFTTQSVNTWYRAVITCSSSATSSTVQVSTKQTTECYCESKAIDSEDTKIHNVTLNTINNTSPAGCQVYTDYTNLSTELSKNSTYTVSVTHGTCGDFYPAYGKVFIDYNQNGVFDPSEVVFSFGPTTSLNSHSGNFTVPSNAIAGTTRMRVILSEDPILFPCDNYYYGETEDYTVIIVDESACINPPVAGNAISTKNQVCPSESFTLSLNGNSIGTGQTYQWQNSTDNINWSNIDGATSTIYQTTQNSNTWYRAVLTCGSSTTSSAVQVVTKQNTECYCESKALESEDSKIQNVTLNTINNTSPAGCQVYTDYTNLSTDLSKNVSYAISVAQGTCGDFYASYGKVYIDFNQNGIFESGEEIFSFGPTTNLDNNTGNFTVPSDAITGLTRMRVVLVEDDIPEPCGTYDYGETQDYSINIIDDASSLVNNDMNTKLIIYPNPVNSKLYLDMQTPANTLYQVEVYDLLGRKIYSQMENISSNTIHIIETSSWPVGHYMIKVSMNDLILTEKVVVVR